MGQGAKPSSTTVRLKFFAAFSFFKENAFNIFYNKIDRFVLINNYTSSSLFGKLSTTSILLIKFWNENLFQYRLTVPNEKRRIYS